MGWWGSGAGGLGVVRGVGGVSRKKTYVQKMMCI